uniref:Uncharacterized protein n=1 Tax=uncultured prokaryote TaxID=198431 RepID=A0A0H5QKX9_9ZZZZ|nr:hypothetical protein [uncultured prokaryote]
MEMEEFIRDLPLDTKCDRCGLKISGLDWGVGRFGAGEWMALCVVKCDKCSRMKVAAAGSSHEAHHRAQMMRTELLLRMGDAGSDGLKNDVNRLRKKK